MSEPMDDAPDTRRNPIEETEIIRMYGQGLGLRTISKRTGIPWERVRRVGESMRANGDGPSPALDAELAGDRCWWATVAHSEGTPGPSPWQCVLVAGHEGAHQQMWDAENPPPDLAPELAP